MWLKKIRESLGLSQSAVAKASDISQQYYQFIESGSRGKKLPVQTAKAIASALGFDWTRFYDDREEVAGDAGKSGDA